MGKRDRAGCFAFFVVLVSRDCCVALPRGAVGLSAVCDCGISRLYTLTIFVMFLFTCASVLFVILATIIQV